MSSRTGRILVELDALLDTRIATIARKYPKVAADMMRTEAYWTRETDDFSEWGGPDAAEFAELYAARDIDTVSNSLRTTIPYIVKDLMMKLELEVEQTPRLSDTGMDVNIWPYEIDEENQKALVSAMMVYGGINTVPKIVSIAPKDLTYGLIHGSYSGVILYDFKGWFEQHVSELRSMYLHDVTIMTAEIRHGPMPTSEELAEAGLRADVDIFRLTEGLYREFFVLEFHPAALFSLHRSDIVNRMTRGLQPETLATQDPTVGKTA